MDMYYQCKCYSRGKHEIVLENPIGGHILVWCGREQVREYIQGGGGVVAGNFCTEE